MKLSTTYAEMGFSVGDYEERGGMYLWHAERKIQVLKTGVPMCGIEVCNQLWKTCLLCIIIFWMKMV